jgi:hypothetical protein
MQETTMIDQDNFGPDDAPDQDDGTTSAPEEPASGAGYGNNAGPQGDEAADD